MAAKTRIRVIIRENTKETPMKPSIVTSLQGMRKIWRKNNFKFTLEEQARYDTLVMIRREQVAAWESAS